MRVLIFEHICGGGMAGLPLPADLVAQGGAMLTAAVEDFIAAGCEVVTTLDPRLNLNPPGATIGTVERFDELARRCDAALLIAPEFEGILEAWTRRVESLGVPNLGCPPEAASLCGDKLALAGMLRDAGVPTPETRPGLVADLLPGVCKPRRGVGCEDTFVCLASTDFAALPRRDDWITQRLATGLAASASLIVHGDRIIPLPAGAQTIRGDRQLSYHGGSLPLPPRLSERAAALALRAASCVEGLNGFVGVDLVLGDDPDPGTGRACGDVVIEINPRLTVSFVALRRLCTTSLARAVMDADAPLAWSGRTIVYDPAGCDAAEVPA